MNKLEELLQKLILQGIQVWAHDGNLRCAGPQHRLTPDVLSQVKEHKAALLQRLSGPTYVAASYGQQGLWSIHQQAPENAAYNVSLAFRIHSAMDVELLRDTIQLLVNRHAALRTRFIWKDDRLMQQIDGQQAAAVEMIDAGNWSEADLRAHVRAFHERPFDLGTGPLLRVAILSHDDQHYSLLLSVHHIVVDGWSIYQLVDEVFTLYDALRHGAVAALPLIQYTYADYVTWQQGILASDEARLWSYWQEQLHGKLPVLQLPTDYPRPPQQRLCGISQPLQLSSTLTEQLKQVARQNGCTLYMVLLAAYQVLLHRYSGQAEILVGLPMAGRSRPDFAEIVGYFTSPVVVRADLCDNPTFAQFLRQVKKQVLAALDHQDYPFVRLVEQLNPPRDSSRSPIFQASFVLQKPHRAQELLLQSNKQTHFGLVIESIPLTLLEGQEDIALELTEAESGLLGYLKGNVDLFAPTTLARMAGHFQVLLEAIVVEYPLRINQPVAHLPLLTEIERVQLVVEWNNTATAYPCDKCVHQLFEEQVERTADAVAVVFAEQALTYGELNQRANQLACYLQSVGVGSPLGADVLVGLCVERSLEMVVGLLGILKAGGAYVPLDPTYPSERLAFLLADAQPRVLLTQTHLRGQLPATTPVQVCLDQPLPPLAAAPLVSSPVTPADLAYVIYTSGSTGQPKGVAIPHGAVVNFLCSMQQQPGISAEDVLLALTTLAFDIAVLELWLPLISGARLVIAPPSAVGDAQQLSGLLAHHGVTLLQATPATWRLLVQAGWSGSPALTLLCGGEALPSSLAAALRPCGAALWNLYGPTETTVWSLRYAVPPSPTQPTVPIGRPLANTTCYIVDQHLQPTPLGVAGELLIGGVGLARGYHNRPDLTARSFIANPFGSGRLYKTGDLARFVLAADGSLTLDYLGRIDHQVKLRGLRIELGEIEAVLRQHPAVQEAVVVVHEHPPGDKRLLAYVVPRPSSATPQHDLLPYRDFLRQKLPDYMLPSAFVLLASLPLTPNGKVDRTALPPPHPSLLSPLPAFVPPRTATEQALAHIWADVLAIEQVGIHDNFFERGGHSLLATQVVSRMRQTFSIDIPLRDFFANPTVSDLSEYIRTRLLMKEMTVSLFSTDKEVEEI